MAVGSGDVFSGYSVDGVRGKGTGVFRASSLVDEVPPWPTPACFTLAAVSRFRRALSGTRSHLPPARGACSRPSSTSRRARTVPFSSNLRPIACISSTPPISLRGKSGARRDRGLIGRGLGRAGTLWGRVYGRARTWVVKPLSPATVHRGRFACKQNQFQPILSRKHCWRLTVFTFWPHNALK